MEKEICIDKVFHRRPFVFVDSIPWYILYAAALCLVVPDNLVIFALLLPRSIVFSKDALQQVGCPSRDSKRSPNYHNTSKFFRALLPTFRLSSVFPPNYKVNMRRSSILPFITDPIVLHLELTGENLLNEKFSSNLKKLCNNVWIFVEKPLPGLIGLML